MAKHATTSTSFLQALVVPVELDKKLAHFKQVENDPNQKRRAFTIYQKHTDDNSEEFIIGRYTGVGPRSVTGSISTGPIEKEVTPITFAEAKKFGDTTLDILEFMKEFKSNAELASYLNDYVRPPKKTFQRQY